MLGADLAIARVAAFGLQKTWPTRKSLGWWSWGESNPWPLQCD